MRGYLNQGLKYGMTHRAFLAGVPVSIGTQPEGGEYDGETAVTLSVVASGTPPFTYQWQSSPDDSDWSDIGGATASSYDAEPEENTYYRVAITNSEGTVYSDSVLVEVANDPVAVVSGEAQAWLDTGEDALYSDQAGTTLQTTDGQPVRSVVPTTAADFVRLKDDADTNNLVYKTATGFPIAGDPVITNPGSILAQMRTVDGAGADANPEIITAGVWWAMVRFRARGISAFDVAIHRWDSNQRLRMLGNDGGAGNVRMKWEIIRAVGGQDKVTAVKNNYSEGDVVVATIFFDGTDLRWKFNGDSAQISEAYAGTLDTVGTDFCNIGDLNGSEQIDHNIWGGGGAIPDGYTASEWWTALVAAHDALVAELS